jgi:hypothetical protein
VSIQDVEASLKMNKHNVLGAATKMNKRAWGADAHKLVQLMMNPLQQQQQQFHAGGNSEANKVATDEEEEEEEVTLDLLGPSSSPPTKLQKLEEEKLDEVRELEARGAELEPSRSREFLELEPADQPLPLPSGWEKCLDLKVGAFQQHSYATSDNLIVDVVCSVLFCSVFVLFDCRIASGCNMKQRLVRR